jgi:hypothetical protein
LRAAPHGSVLFIACEDVKTHDFASPGLHITVNGVDAPGVGAVVALTYRATVDQPLQIPTKSPADSEMMSPGDTR